VVDGAGGEHELDEVSMVQMGGEQSDYWVLGQDSGEEGEGVPGAGAGVGGSWIGVHGCVQWG